jgi:hypothetical protein
METNPSDPLSAAARQVETGQVSTVMKVIALILGAGAFLLVPLSVAQESPPTPPPVQGSTGETTPHHPDENSQLLQEWAPPTDEPHASGSGDARRFLGQYLSSKPLPEVWTYYATKLGMTPPPTGDQPYQANFQTEQFPRTGPRPADGHAALSIKNIQFPEQTERAATFMRREPNGKTISVFLASQGEHTFVFVMVVPGS